MALDWQPFTEAEWAGLGGAESFANGVPPLLAGLEVNGAPAFAVLDREGLTLHLGEDCVEEVRLVGSPASVWRAVALLRPEMTSLALVGLGFGR